MGNLVDLINRSKTKKTRTKRSKNRHFRKFQPTTRRLNKKYKTGLHTSAKCGFIRYRSGYELDYAIILDMNPEVKSYSHESINIEYSFRSRPMRYLPDFLITYHSGKSEVHEVKPQVMVDKPKNQAKFKAAEAFCRSHNMVFRVITEAIIYPKRM